jgi:hypothetical protein
MSEQWEGRVYRSDQDEVLSGAMHEFTHLHSETSLRSSARKAKELVCFPAAREMLIKGHPNITDIDLDDDVSGSLVLFGNHSLQGTGRMKIDGLPVRFMFRCDMDARTADVYRFVIDRPEVMTW